MRSTVVALGIFAAVPGARAESWIQGRLERDTDWEASRWTTEAHADHFKLYWKGALDPWNELDRAETPSWAKPSAGIAWTGTLGEIHAGSIGGLSPAPRSITRSVFGVAPAVDRPGIGASSRADGVAWVAPGKRAHAAWGRDANGAWRSHFGIARRGARGRSWEARAFLDEAQSGELLLLLRGREIAASATGGRVAGETRATLSVGDRAGRAAFRAGWTSNPAGSWGSAGVGVGVAEGALSGTRAEVACTGPGAPVSAAGNVARTAVRITRGMWLASFVGSMRAPPQGAVRGTAEWSVSHDQENAGLITASVVMEPGIEGPSAAGIAWRGSRRRVRWSGLAEISVRRGRVIHLALDTGRDLRVRLELRVQDRAFAPPRAGVEIAVRRTLGRSARNAAPPGSDAD